MAAGRSSTGISPRPMLMGAAHDALWASNARVSLSCLRILAHRLPHLFYGSVMSLTCLVGVPSCGLATGSWRTGRPAPHRQIVSVCLMLRRRPPAGLSLSRSDTGHHMERGKHAAPGPESAQVKFRDGDNQLRFQPPAHMLVVAVRFQVLTSLRAGRQFFSSPFAHYCYGNAAVWLVFRIYIKKFFAAHNRFLSFRSG